MDPSPQTLTVYTDNQGVAIEDVYSNVNSFKSQCASISGELHMFCIGGLRYFQNNTLMENSPSWGLINPAKDIHNVCIFKTLSMYTVLHYLDIIMSAQRI